MSGNLSNLTGNFNLFKEEKERYEKTIKQLQQENKSKTNQVETLKTKY